MESHIVTSKGSALFTQGRLLLIFVVFAILVSISPLSHLKGSTLLVWIFVFIKKNLQINVEQKKFKDGQLKRWKTLSEDGYISVVRKIKMSTKKIDNESLKLLWVEDGQSTHIYSPRELEEGESMALYLAEKWNCGVYLPHKKVWLRERG
jgi:hypothetical protein